MVVTVVRVIAAELVAAAAAAIVVVVVVAVVVDVLDCCAIKLALFLTVHWFGPCFTTLALSHPCFRFVPLNINHHPA